MKTSCIKYIIQREDGQFYYKNASISSLYGYTENFGKAHLFETEKGAEKRLYTANPMKARIRPVTITLGVVL